MCSDKTLGISGDKCIARKATIPRAVEAFSNTNVHPGRIIRSRSLGLKDGSCRTKSAVKTAPSTDGRTASFADTEMLVMIATTAYTEITGDNAMLAERRRVLLSPPSPEYCHPLTS